MISVCEDTSTLMIPDEEHFTESYDRYSNGALTGQTAQETRPNCETWACMKEVVS